MLRDPFIGNNRAHPIPEAIATFRGARDDWSHGREPGNAPMRSFRGLTDPRFVRDDAAGECIVELKCRSVYGSPRKERAETNRQIAGKFSSSVSK